MIRPSASGSRSSAGVTRWQVTAHASAARISPAAIAPARSRSLSQRMGRSIRSSPINGRIAGAAPSHPGSQAERHTWLRAAVYPCTHSATARQHLEGSAARRNRDSGRRFEFPERWTCERRDIITILYYICVKNRYLHIPTHENNQIIICEQCSKDAPSLHPASDFAKLPRAPPTVSAPAAAPPATSCDSARLLSPPCRLSPPRTVLILSQCIGGCCRPECPRTGSC